MGKAGGVCPKKDQDREGSRRGMIQLKGKTLTASKIPVKYWKSPINSSVLPI